MTRITVRFKDEAGFFPFSLTSPSRAKSFFRRFDRPGRLRRRSSLSKSPAAWFGRCGRLLGHRPIDRARRHRRKRFVGSSGTNESTTFSRHRRYAMVASRVADADDAGAFGVAIAA